MTGAHLSLQKLSTAKFPRTGENQLQEVKWKKSTIIQPRRYPDNIAPFSLQQKTASSYRRNSTRCVERSTEANVTHMQWLMARFLLHVTSSSWPLFAQYVATQFVMIISRCDS